MKDCECTKSLYDDLAVTCDKTVDTAESAPINPSDSIDYWLIAILISIACLLSFVVIVVKLYMKHALTIPCLLSY